MTETSPDTDTTAVIPTDPPLARVATAEFVGTMLLMLIGPGSAILAADVIGNVGVAACFGLALLVGAYVVGPVSGCHINPAVTLGMALGGQLPWQRVGLYWISQLAGAIAGGAILFSITDGGDEAFDKTGIFAANGWGDKIGNSYGAGAAMVVEIVFTAILVFAVLSTTVRKFAPGFGGLAVGATLGMIHLVTIPVDNTSVNPARSLGAAVFSGSDAMSQLWLFIVFPLIGAVAGTLVWVYVHAGDFDLPGVDNIDMPFVDDV
ncbi:aquaporin [Desertimonas flava]|uniref:aquaporin n=1 Tax=Desertimonas flava TaxID=2064846 RepID=UPI001968BD17|nr:aquaporin [Desertimonas flava]